MDGEAARIAGATSYASETARARSSVVRSATTCRDWCLLVVALEMAAPRDTADQPPVKFSMERVFTRLTIGRR